MEVFEGLAKYGMTGITLASLIVVFLIVKEVMKVLDRNSTALGEHSEAIKDLKTVIYTFLSSKS